MALEDTVFQRLFQERGVTVSPDGKTVYVTSLRSSAVVAFSRNLSAGSPDYGKLTPVQTLVDNNGGVNGLAGAYGVTVSPDGRHVYVAGQSDDAVAVFSRNTTTGQLTFLQVLLNGLGGVSGLNQAERLVVSPDGKHLYVAAADRSLAVFARLTDTLSANFGRLTFVEAKVDGVAGADGLQMPSGVVVSPDGAQVYVSNEVHGDAHDWLGIFSRNVTTGALTYVSKLLGNAVPSCGIGISARNDVAVLADGMTVVAPLAWAGAVVTLSRAAGTGLLTVVDWECEDLQYSRGLVNVDALAVSADGKNAYVATLGPPSGVAMFVLSEPGYAGWLAANHPGASQVGFNQDANGNGTSNGIAYALGENFKPTPAFSGASLTLPAPPSRVPLDVILSVQRSPAPPTAGSWAEILRYENGAQVFAAPGVSVSFGNIRNASPPGGSGFYRFSVRRLP